MSDAGLRRAPQDGRTAPHQPASATVRSAQQVVWRRAVAAGPTALPTLRPAVPCRFRAANQGQSTAICPAMPQVEVDPATYLPPPLRPGAVGWYPEWGKVGQGARRRRRASALPRRSARAAAASSWRQMGRGQACHAADPWAAATAAACCATRCGRSTASAGTRGRKLVGSRRQEPDVDQTSVEQARSLCLQALSGACCKRQPLTCQLAAHTRWPSAGR